jgi:dihydrodipicolinate synthase/N-acetylneuraminate lyase
MPLSGIFTPNMTPLDRRGEIDEAELRRYIEWLIEKGVNGIYPNGSTGEFTRFTAEERRRNVEIICDQVAGRLPILAGAAEANVRETLKACETYLSYGASAVAVVAPFYFKLSPGAVYAYFREIAINSPIDVTLYNIPMFANPIDVPTVQRLAELPRIVGIKDSSGDIAQMMRMMAAIEANRPDFTFLTGWEPAMTPMLAIGCHGGTFAMSGIAPEVTRAVYELIQAGNWPAARQLQFGLTKLFDAVVLGVNFPEGVRAALAFRGFNFGCGRQPLDETEQLNCHFIEQSIDDLLMHVTGSIDRL